MTAECIVLRPLFLATTKTNPAIRRQNLEITANGGKAIFDRSSQFGSPRLFFCSAPIELAILSGRLSAVPHSSSSTVTVTDS